VVAFLSDNDPYIKYPYAKKYFDEIGAEVRTCTGKGHFNEDT
jgi:predicted alpha/beta hydrolase family esterase